MTLEQAITARNNALAVKANALAALAGGDSDGVPGGKPNSSGGANVDHMGTLRQMDAEIERLNHEIIRLTGAASVSISYDT